MNILCMAVSRLKPEAQKEYNRDLSNEQTYMLYDAMSEIVIHSAETFIQEDFEIVIFEDEVNNYQEIFHKNFNNVYEEFTDNGPNNILFLDCDTLVTAPVEVFGKYKHFQMFNYTDPKRLSGNDRNNKYNLDFAHYFNAGCRYYPAEMDQSVWDLGWSYAKDWDYSIWGTEQLIFNAMMYSQDSDVNTWLKPEMNYQMMNVPFNNINNTARISQLNTWNGCDVNDAKIMHLHGTRGAANTVLLQWELWRRITGEQFEFSKFVVETDSVGNAVKLSFK